MSARFDCGHVCCGDPGDPIHAHRFEPVDCPDCGDLAHTAVVDARDQVVAFLDDLAGRVAAVDAKVVMSLSDSIREEPRG
jgi:hypothetical protein